MSSNYWSIAFVALLGVYSASSIFLQLGPIRRALIQSDDAMRDFDGCPLCDSSVYSYCSHKLFHDACCCAGQTGIGYPGNCQYSDCRYLHANSCYEHNLITRCCCESPYKK